MAQNSRGIGAGPSTAGPAGVLFCISDDSTAAPEDVWISHPDLLRRRSLGLREIIDRNREQQNIPLKIEGDSTIHRDAMRWVLENLQHLQLDVSPSPEILARHCDVLWKYKCIPDSFKELGDSMQPRSSSSSFSSADRHGSNGSSASPSRGSRCWQGRKNCHTCQQLITIAIVLDQQEILEYEIKTAVWGTFREIDITVLPGLDIKGKLLQRYAWR
jgi:hypothetical protein